MAIIIRTPSKSREGREEPALMLPTPTRSSQPALSPSRPGNVATPSPSPEIALPSLCHQLTSKARPPEIESFSFNLSLGLSQLAPEPLDLTLVPPGAEYGDLSLLSSSAGNRGTAEMASEGSSDVDRQIVSSQLHGPSTPSRGRRTNQAEPIYIASDSPSESDVSDSDEPSAARTALGENRDDAVTTPRRSIDSDRLSGSSPVSRSKERSLSSTPKKASLREGRLREGRLREGRLREGPIPNESETGSSTGGAAKTVPKGAPEPVTVSSHGAKRTMELESDDDDVVVTSPMKKPRRGRVSPVGAIVPPEEKAQAAGPASTGGKQPVRQAIRSKNGFTDEDEGEDVVEPPRRRRLIRRRSNAPTRKTDGDEEDDDLREDMEALRSTQTVENRTRTRVVPLKKTLKQKQLEKLRRRRAGEKEAESEESDGGDAGPRRGIYDTDSELDEELFGRDSDDEVSGTEEIRQSLRHGRNDGYDEDFVTEDDDVLGAPAAEMAEMPIEFTLHAHKKPREHFKDAVEWMVQNKLNPAFSRGDGVYRVAFRKLDDEVQGYTHSKFTSSVWRPDFVRALQARPILYVEPTGVMEGDKCQACNRSGHPPSFQMQFDGRPYHRESLEAVSDDEDDDEDDDGKSYNSAGLSVPESETRWLVGRFCKANAETAHSLTHWRHHLNEWVLDFLEGAGHTTPESILRRDGWSSKRRREYANAVVDKMVGAGEIKKLYRAFKDTLEAARDAKPGRYNTR
ncbi:MAG: hypothetical protein M1832_004318 [Thelocarpon impressellum]|nr:MAG: hypothetical protein M1832_004318 [Thelocarpon impressellum]